MKRNADLRSLRIDLADASLGSGRCPTYGVFGVRSNSVLLYTLRSAGARGLDGLPSIDISLRWSERNSINMSPRPDKSGFKTGAKSDETERRSAFPTN